MAQSDWDACMQVFGWREELSTRELEEFRRVGVCEDHPAGALIFSPSAEPRSTFLLHAGLISVWRMGSDGEQVTFGFVGPGEIFGELSSLWGLPRESYATAVKPSRVCRLPNPTFRRVADRHPPVLADVMSLVAERFKRMESRVEQLVLADVYGRVAAILLELAEGFGRVRQGETRIDIPLTQGELATLVGASRQTVNLAVGRLRGEGLVQHRDGHFVLPKRHELEHRLSNPVEF